MKKLVSLSALIIFSAVAVCAQEAHIKRADTRGKEKSSEKASPRAARVLQLGPSTTYLKDGLSIDEVIRFLGRPTSVSERQNGDSLLATYTFPRSPGRVLVAEFEAGLLVRSCLAILYEIVQAEKTR